MKQTAYCFMVEPGDEIRIDKFLSDQLQDISRSQIQRMIDGGNVTQNGLIVERSSIKVQPNDEIKIIVQEENEDGLVPEDIPLDIVYEDEHVILLNKPAGLVVHPGAGNSSGTLVNALLAHFPPIRDVGEMERPGVVHRIDKETSGILVFAKTNKAYKWLIGQFKAHQVQKTYLALVDGHPPTPTGRIEAPIERDPRSRTRMKVGLQGHGKPAVSEYFELERFINHALLEVRPITGRTHQIRVHLSYLGIPVAGDSLYGRRHSSIELDRFFLHASSIKIKLLGERVPRIFNVPLPVDLQAVIDHLRQYERKSS